jgi:hypothetical protein
MIWPLATRVALDTETDDRYDTEIFKPETGSIVTEFMPATEPAKVTTPEAGALTSVPTGTP